MGQHIEMGQREWNGLVLRLIRHIGHLEADELAAYGLAEPVGACTRAYLAKDVLAWRQHAHEIQWRLVQLGYRVPWREPHQKLRDASIRVLTGIAAQEWAFLESTRMRKTIGGNHHA
jgi:hypothetical protein